MGGASLETFLGEAQLKNHPVSSYICSFVKDLVFTIYTKNLGKIMHITLHRKYLLTSMETD